MQLYFYEQNIIYLTKLSVQRSISELQAVWSFNLRGQKAYHDGQMAIMVNK